MATTYYFEEERLKPAVAAYLNSGCNFNEVSSHLKKQMRLFVQEDIPNIFLSDGKHFIEGHFTKDAINDFRKNYSNVKFSNLREKILVVTKWRLITRYEDSRTQYCSYQNISIHLIVENFRPLMYERVAPKCFNNTCIFRDSDIQCLLKNKRQEAIQQQIIYQHFFMHNTDFNMPSARDIFESESQNRFKKLSLSDINDHLGIMMADLTEEEEQRKKDILEKREFERNLVHDFNKQLLQKIQSSLVQNEVIRCEKEKPTKDELVNDSEDFKEMRDIIIINSSAEGMIIDTSKDQNAQYYDVKRLQIQEKGEEEYYFLRERKTKQLQDTLDDEMLRNQTTLDYEHFHNHKDKSRLEFQRQMQIKKIQNAQVKQKRTKKVISYRLGYTASEIKDRVLRFMTTFNATQAVSNNEETYLEERIELTVDQHRGAYSQIDQNDLTDLGGNNNGGGLALSQYYQGPQSILNGDLGNDTESEPDEDPITYEQKQKLRGLVSKVKPTISLFKRYYEWFNQHEVTTKSKYEELQENIRRSIAEAAAREAEAQKERERKEQLAREREAQLIEAQRLREEQAELEKQRKIELKALKLRQKLEEEERKQREFQAEVERQRQQEIALEQEQQRKLQIEREAAELKRQQEIAEAAALIAIEQEKERKVQLEIAAAAEQLRKIKIEEERRKLQEEAAKAKHEEALKQQKLAYELEQARLQEEARARAQLEEAQRQQRILEEQQARIKLETEAALLAEQARQLELAEKRKQEELAVKERERQKQIAAQEALKKEQERQERRRMQLEQEAQEQRAKFEEEKRLQKLHQEEELRRAKQEAEIERARYEEQLRIENEIKRKREYQELLANQAIEALSGKSLKASSSMAKEDETGLNLNDGSSFEDEDCEDGDQQTAAFIVHSQEEEISPEQIEIQQQMPEQEAQIVYEEEDQSPQLTPNKDMTIVYPQPSPGSFVDQNPIPQPYDGTLADLVGSHQNGSQQLKPSTSQEKDHNSSHRHHSKKHKRSQSSHSKSKKHLKKRKNRSSSSDSSSSAEESESESKSLSSISNEESDVDSSEQRSSRSGSSSDNSSDSQRSSSSDSSSSIEQRKQAKMLLALLNPKKSSKSKKDKKHKQKGKELDMIAKLLLVAQSMQSKSKKDRSSKKHHKSSASKNHHHHHSQSRVKDEKPQSVQKIPQPFTIDNQLTASPNSNLEIKQSPSPQKPGVNYSYKHLDSTQGSTEPQVKKQLSPVEIVKTTHRINAMTTSFDSWKQQNENQNGQNFHNTSPQPSQSKVIPPWNQSRDEEEDNSEQIALLLAQDKTLQKRRRHE